MSFDRQQYEGNVFWKSYCEIEKARDERLVQHRKQCPWYIQLWQGWKQVDDDEFWLFYLNKTGNLCITVLSVNFCFSLLVFRKLLDLAGLQDGNWQVVHQAQLPHLLRLFIYLGIWMIYPLMGMVLQLMHRYMPETLHRWAHGRPIQYWNWLKYTILLSKTIVVWRNLIDLTYASGDSCYGLTLLGTESPKYAAVTYLFQMMVDINQLMVLSLLPFSWQWVVSFSAIVYLDILLRIYGCRDVLFGGDVMYTFLYAAMVHLAATIYNVGIYSAFSFQQCLRSCYQNIADQHLATEEKIKLVNMFCRDIKSSSQQIVQSFQTFESLLSNSHLHVKQFAKKSKAVGKKINSMVDDMLFLIRIEEKRFHLSCSDVVDLQEVTKEVISMLEEAEESTSTVPHINLEDVVDIDVPSDMVYTEQHCLRLLLFYGLTAVMQLFPSIKTNPHSCTIAIKQMEHSTKPRAKKAKQLHDFEWFVCSITTNELSKHPKEKHPNEGFEAACMMCQRIVDTYGGAFLVEANKLSFELPGKRKLIEDDNTMEMSPRASQRGNIPKSIIRKYLSQQVMAYITDSTLEVLLLDSLKLLPGGDQIALHHRINIALTKVYDVILVQSFEACKEVREKGFRGKLVLMSERLPYLDDNERMLFDVGISLPAQQSVLSDLIHKLISIDINLKTTTSFSSAQVGHLEKKKKKMKGAIEYLQDNYNNWIIAVLFKQHVSSERFESYSKWRLFLPDHKSVLSTLLSKSTFPLYSATAIFAYILGIVGPRIMFGSIIYSIYANLRSLMIKQLSEIFHNPLSRWWYTFVIFEVVMSAMAGLYENSNTLHEDVKNGIYPFAFSHFQHYRNDSITELVHDKAQKIYGSEILYYPLFVPSISKIFPDSAPWPFGQCGPLIPLLRMMVFFDQVYRYVLKEDMMLMLLWAVLLMSSVIFIIQYFTESLWQIEFMELYDLTISRDFVDICLRTSRMHLLGSLHQLEVIHKQFNKQVMTEIEQDHLFVGQKYMLTSERLVLQMLIVKEISFDLNMSDHRYLLNKMSNFRNDMKAQYLQALITEVCVKFFSSVLSHDRDIIRCWFGEIALKIHVQMDPSLLMIRVDEDLFTAMLSQAIRSSIQNIQQASQLDLLQQDYEHELLLWIESYPMKDQQKFTDVRFMKVLVLDSGQIVRKRASESCQFVPRIIKSHAKSSSGRLRQRSSQQQNRAKRVSTEDTNSFHENHHYEHHMYRGQDWASDVGSISNKVLEYFGMKERCQHGSVMANPPYHHYQLLYFPYLLCTDSHKYTRWYTNHHPCSWTINRKEKLDIFKLYCASYGLDIQTASQSFVVKKMQQMLMSPAAILTNRLSERKLNDTIARKRHFHGRISIFQSSKRTLSGSSGSQRVSRYPNILRTVFEKEGWTVVLAEPEELLHNLPMHLYAHLIWIDIDSLPSFWLYDIKDLIRYLRCQGYHQMLTLSSKMFANPLQVDTDQSSIASKSSPGLISDVQQAQVRQFQREYRNAYQSVQRDVDTIVCCEELLPIFTIKQLMKRVEQHVLKFAVH